MPPSETSNLRFPAPVFRVLVVFKLRSLVEIVRLLPCVAIFLPSVSCTSPDELPSVSALISVSPAVVKFLGNKTFSFAYRLTAPTPSKSPLVERMSKSTSAVTLTPSPKVILSLVSAVSSTSAFKRSVPTVVLRSAFIAIESSLSTSNVLKEEALFWKVTLESSF